MNRCRHQGTSARQGVFTVDGATVCILSGGPQVGAAGIMGRWCGY
jgi:hypothetical protein